VRYIAAEGGDDSQRLIQVLTDLTQPSPKKTIEQIASEQGKGPLEFSKIRDMGSFFPDDENIDDLIRTVRVLRQDKSVREVD
jgi:hypothetical protein